MYVPPRTIIQQPHSRKLVSNMRASIVINTHNRRDSLAETLASLRQLRYPHFEVVVVNGPSTDGTGELLEEWSGSIKVLTCPVPNLSVSRNIGIAAAAGDIVAFIDDDAIPDPQWLTDIVAGYDSDEVGAVGGPVYDSAGYSFQTKYIVCDRFGGAVEDIGFNPTYAFNIPGAPRYASLLGTNSSFRRSVLLENGGFDEEFAYFLDETDLCLRIVDSGRIVKYVDSAFVYHKFTSSDVRVSYGGKGILVRRYQPLKSKAYFAIKHGAEAHGFPEAMQRILDYADWHRRDLKFNIDWCDRHGVPHPDLAEDLEEVINSGVADGVRRALSGERTYLSSRTLDANAAAFKHFSSRMVSPERINVCLFTQHYPPKPVDGIGRALHEFSTAIASLGHTVHILTTSDTHNRVDLEDGVWVHRLTIKHHTNPIPPFPDALWNYSQTMLEEVKRIHQFDRVDLIEAPAWDCEGIAALIYGKIPVVTSLHTPMLIVASTHPTWMIDASKMQNDIVPILECERQVMLFSDGLAANTNSIVKIIEREYDIAFEQDRIKVVGRGFHDRTQTGSMRRNRTALSAAGSGSKESKVAFTEDTVDVLFLGRLEYRKGIDVLIAALQRLLPEFPHVMVDIVGEEVAEFGKTFKAQYLELAAGMPWARQVTFHGRVAQELLGEYLEGCDIFVAPSRFESFGLIYLEAMMYGKPCVGTDIGGIAEVVIDGETGILVKAGDPNSLIEALRRLILSKELRSQLGEQGRRRYLNELTAHAWAKRSLQHYKTVISRPRPHRESSPNDGPIVLSRHCSLSEFWYTSSLFPLLSKIGKSSIDRRVWAFCLAIAILIQKRRQYAESAASRALMISDHQLPSIDRQFSGWRFELISTADTENDFSQMVRPIAGLDYPAAHFDVVISLVVVDPLDRAFAKVVAEIARVCRPGGSVHIVFAVGDKVADQLVEIIESLDDVGLQSKMDLRSFLLSASTSPPLPAGEDGLEPNLTAKIAGAHRPVAMMEFERVKVSLSTTLRNRMTKTIQMVSWP